MYCSNRMRGQHFIFFGVKFIEDGMYQKLPKSVDFFQGVIHKIKREVKWTFSES